MQLRSAISVVVSLVLCVVWGLKGQVFVLIAVGLAAVFYLLGRLIQTIAATPKFRRANPIRIIRQAANSSHRIERSKPDAFFK